MPSFDFQTPIDASADDLFAWHARDGAFERLAPPWAPIELKKMEGIRDGQEAAFRIGVGPLRVKWVAEHTDYVEGRQFKDVQKKGPFASWVHTHRMEPRSEDASTLHDHIDYELPLGGLGRAVADGQIRQQVEQQFAYRHRITRDDLACYQKYDGPRLTVAVSGSGGLIGSSLTALLTTQGHTVVRITRSRPEASSPDIYWNHRTGEVDAEKFNEIDAVIHLAGENIFAPRWTQQKKTRIYASRVRGTKLLVDAMTRVDDPPDTLLCASAIGIYGDRGDETLTETSALGESGFLMAVCRDWERATEPAAAAGLRVANLRTGIALSPAGGALALMRRPFELGLGGTAGRKDQWFPWIALDDVLGGYYHALMTGAVEGPANLTAPNPATMQTFVETLASVMSRPAFFHVPPAVIRLVMGEAGDELALQSARVLPAKLEETGYAFRYPRLADALRHQLGYALEPLAA